MTWFSKEASKAKGEGGVLFLSEFDSIGEFLFCTLDVFGSQGNAFLAFLSVSSEADMADL